MLAFHVSSAQGLIYRFSNMSKCFSYRKTFDKEPIIVACVCCNMIFHGTPKCASVSEPEAALLSLEDKDPLLVYRCVRCKDSGGIISGLYSSLSG